MTSRPKVSARNDSFWGSFSECIYKHISFYIKFKDGKSVEKIRVIINIFSQRCPMVFYLAYTSSWSWRVYMISRLILNAGSRKPNKSWVPILNLIGLNWVVNLWGKERQRVHLLCSSYDHPCNMYVYQGEREGSGLICSCLSEIVHI